MEGGFWEDGHDGPQSCNGQQEYDCTPPTGPFQSTKKKTGTGDRHSANSLCCTITEKKEPLLRCSPAASERIRERKHERAHHEGPHNERAEKRGNKGCKFDSAEFVL